MKFLIYSDNHWCQYSSILRSRGDRFSKRLENQIQSLNWAENLAITNRCDYVICLGDFFDKSELNAEEITALKEIMWSNLPHYFIVGNHEMGTHDLLYNSAHALDMVNNLSVISKPETYLFGELEVVFLPYILETNRKDLIEYLPPRTHRKRLILSHNDISGVQMGKFVSENGFSISEIENSCDLFINGHLHNGAKITDKVINIGNLTGQNFSENADLYKHTAFIADTETLGVEVYTNPYALNFYKLDFTYEPHSLFFLDDGFEIYKSILNEYSIVTVKCMREDVNRVKEFLESLNVLESRVVVHTIGNIIHDDNVKIDLSIDHLKSFEDYVLSYIGCDEIIKSELQEVLE